MKLKPSALVLLLALAAAAPLRADLALPSFEVMQAELAKADALYASKDIPGLLALLKGSSLVAQRNAAIKLGRLGAAEALEDLRKLDARYANFACMHSGEFGVAVLLIENPGKDRQRAILLDVATESGPQTRHAYSVIDVAGRELAEYDGTEIEKRLANVDTYGAQYTVLSLRCRQLSASDAIAKCIDVLSRHETPPKAQAAEELLITFGPSAAGPLGDLKARAEARQGPLDSTVAKRCERLLEEISRGR